MPTKTIGVREDVYERLSAEKRDDESFSDAIERLVDETRSDWRRSFGKLAEEGDELERVTKEQRSDLSDSVAES
ncbi:MAG: antitoxin VapB family protein [Halobacteriales archaeon]|nr:antitoxin VapB family protein [Halobacteriales archaeon]